MSEIDFTAPRVDGYELALANRKLTTIVMGMTLLMGLVACLSYLAGRTVSNVRVQTETAAQARSAPVVVLPAARKPSPVPSAVTPPPALASSQLYFQVGFVDAEHLGSFSARYRALDLPVMIVPAAEGPDAMSRVLIGPIDATPERRRVEAILLKAEASYFARRL